MKNTKKCPKCNSEEILKIEAYSAGFDYTIGYNNVTINTYICCNCGFIEKYIAEKDISKLIKKYKNKKYKGVDFTKFS